MEPCRSDVDKLEWSELAEAPGLPTKALLEVPEHGLTVHVNRVPDDGVPEHEHPMAHLMFVLRGRGSLTVQGAGEFGLQEGAFAFVPPGRAHSIQNVDGELEILNTAVPLPS